MEIFLTLVFVINGELSIMEGYEPRLQPDMATCVERRDFAVEYLKTVPGVSLAGAVCGSLDVAQEAIDGLNEYLRM